MTSDEVQNRWLALIGVVLAIGALYVTRAVTMPLGFAVFLLVLVWPLQRRLERHMPYFPALLVTLAVVALATASFVGGLLYCLAEIAEQVPGYVQAVRGLIDAVAEGLRGMGLPLPELPEDAGSEGLVDAAGLVGRAVETVLLVAVLLVLGMAEAHETVHRLRDEIDPVHSRAALDIGGEIARRFRRYILTRTLTGGLAALLTGLVCWWAGVDPPVVWGIFAFLLYYVPAIGHIIAVILPSVAALPEHGLSYALGVGGVLGVIQVGIGNWVDPKLLGATLEISPTVILFSVVFWGFVWGLPGALLGVPITVAMIVVLGRFDQTRWMAVLLGGPAATRNTTVIPPV